VIAGFVVFFMDDPAAAVARWGRLLRPSGRLALSTFSELTDDDHALYAAVGEALAPFRPAVDGEDVPRSLDPTRTPEWLAALFAEAGLEDVETVEIEQRSEYASPDLFFDFLLSAGGRAIVEAIPRERRDEARAALSTAIVEHLRQPDGSYARTTGMRLTRARRPGDPARP
jgi:SAM-dependent methyltransferase